jgi:hypothetical protein
VKCRRSVSSHGAAAGYHGWLLIKGAYCVKLDSELREVRANLLRVVFRFISSYYNRYNAAKLRFKYFRIFWRVVD